MSTKKATGKRKSGEEDATKVAKTPMEQFLKEQKDFLNRNTHILGCMVIKDIGSDDEDDEDEEESDDEKKEEDTSKYTKEQMESLRYIMMTKGRDEQLAKMRELVLGDQANGMIMSFNTSFSWHVLETWRTMKKRLSKVKTKPSLELDMLMAYTYVLKEYDTWMNDNEGGMGEIVEGLASAWKRLLGKYDDTKLGWDVEYTKPGVLELLHQFKEQIEDMDECYELGEEVGKKKMELVAIDRNKNCKRYWGLLGIIIVYPALSNGYKMQLYRNLALSDTLLAGGKRPGVIGTE